VRISKLLSPLSVQNVIMKRLTNCTIDVGITVSQRSNFILDAVNASSGVSASVAKMVHPAEDLVRAV